MVYLDQDDTVVLEHEPKKPEFGYGTATVVGTKKPGHLDRLGRFHYLRADGEVAWAVVTDFEPAPEA